MVFINSEGKFNENTYLIDGQVFSMLFRECLLYISYFLNYYNFPQ